MAHFYTQAINLQHSGGKPEPEVIDANLWDAAAIAERIAPYQHTRLSAVKLAGDRNNPLRVWDNTRRAPFPVKLYAAIIPRA
jgi:hypothetical protein